MMQLIRHVVEKGGGRGDLGDTSVKANEMCIIHKRRKHAWFAREQQPVQHRPAALWYNPCAIAMQSHALYETGGARWCIMHAST